uniref:Uncharacterized protein n=1 Tax=Branchiostoma floridae TaxID=7739 RepID=C3Y8N2_BRAFL|eukprot:XP_002607459.1 hypothetical protein BRAFLDRAFT_69885 [Branchiostoma floridae]
MPRAKFWTTRLVTASPNWCYISPDWCHAYQSHLKLNSVHSENPSPLLTNSAEQVLGVGIDGAAVMASDINGVTGMLHRDNCVSTVYATDCTRLSHKQPKTSRQSRTPTDWEYLPTGWPSSSEDCFDESAWLEETKEGQQSDYQAMNQSLDMEYRDRLHGITYTVCDITRASKSPLLCTGQAHQWIVFLLPPVGRNDNVGVMLQLVGGGGVVVNPTNINIRMKLTYGRITVALQGNMNLETAYNAYKEFLAKDTNALLLYGCMVEFGRVKEPPPTPPQTFEQRPCRMSEKRAVKTARQAFLKHTTFPRREAGHRTRGARGRKLEPAGHRDVTSKIGPEGHQSRGRGTAMCTQFTRQQYQWVRAWPYRQRGCNWDTLVGESRPEACTTTFFYLVGEAKISFTSSRRKRLWVPGML